MTLTKLVVLVLSLALVGGAQAQVELDKHVVAAGGGMASSAGASMTFTVGQPAVGLTSDNLYDLNIGFWTPESSGVSAVPGTETPMVFNLNQNFPNPFNPRTVISFSLPEAAPVNLSVYNIRGERVRSLISEERGIGNHQVIWDGTDDFGLSVSSGTYVARIVSSAGTQNRKMLLVR